MSARKILISGVGRSGTSFLFEEMAAALRAAGPAALFYEPYQWSPAKVVETGRVHAEPFDSRNLSPFGIYVHCESPIFLRGPHPVHDLMVNRILAPEVPDRSVLAKLIRGNSRLMAYLKADPAVKVVGVVRDVFGTVNSVSNHFSFFGSEFFPTDLPRFREEVAALYGDELPEPQGGEATRQAVQAAWWWKYQTQALFEAKRAFPGRVSIVDYDSLRRNPNPAYGIMEKLTGLPLRKYRLKDRVGIVSSANYLSEVAPAHFAPFQDWFAAEIADKRHNAVLSRDSLSLAPIDTVIASYGQKRPAVVPRYPQFRTGIGWRYAAKTLETRNERLEALHEQALAQYRDSGLGEFRAAAPAVAGKGAADGAEVSVIVPLWNAADSLERTVSSITAQRDVRVELVMIDDASPDASAEVAEAILDRGVPGRLIRNQRNLGPGLSRHKGVLAARAALISTLDADDHMYPYKLAREVEALAGDPMAVAYSQVEYARPGQSDLWDYAELEGMDKDGLVASIAGRRHRIPRDMTFSRALYMRSRGFDGLLRMYEDFAFKIELAGLASKWVNTGSLGMRYDHSFSGASVGGLDKHAFFLHAAFLKNADMLALRLNSAALDCLESAVSFCKQPPYLERGIARLRSRAEFPGNLLADLRQMRRSVGRKVFRDDLQFQGRLRRVYAEFSS